MDPKGNASRSTQTHHSRKINNPCHSAGPAANKPNRTPKQSQTETKTPLPPQSLPRVPTPLIKEAINNLQSTQSPMLWNKLDFFNNLINILSFIIENSPILLSPNNPKNGMRNKHITSLQFIHFRSIPPTLQVDEQIIRGNKIQFKP